jgi:hypothetical protein
MDFGPLITIILYLLFLHNEHIVSLDNGYGSRVAIFIIKNCRILIYFGANSRGKIRL